MSCRSSGAEGASEPQPTGRNGLPTRARKVQINGAGIKSPPAPPNPRRLASRTSNEQPA